VPAVCVIMALKWQDEEETIRRSGTAALTAIGNLHGLDLGRDSRDLEVRAAAPVELIS
jgi:hypothetical protein